MATWNNQRVNLALSLHMSSLNTGYPPILFSVSSLHYFFFHIIHVLFVFCKGNMACHVRSLTNEFPFEHIIFPMKWPMKFPMEWPLMTILPSGYVKHSYWKWPFFRGFSHKQWWFSIAMLIYKRVSDLPNGLIRTSCAVLRPNDFFGSGASSVAKGDGCSSCARWWCPGSFTQPVDGDV